MNQHLHSPTKLTEFARDFDEEPDTLFGRFVNKIQNVYNHSYNTVNDVSLPSQQQQVQEQQQEKRSKSVFYADAHAKESSPGVASQMSRDSSANSLDAGTQQALNAQLSNDPSTSSSSTATLTDESSEAALEKLDDLPSETNEGRTMVNVLKRISNLMASKNSDLRNYKDTHLQQLWMPDSKAKECYDCSQKFSTFRRKHHCRLCGQIFCSKCCNQVVPGRIIKCAGDLKVCNYCSKIVLSYLKSPNIAVDLQADLQALQQDLTSKLEDKENITKLSTLPMHASLPRKISVGYQEERFATTHQTHSLSFDDRKNILQQSNSLIALHEEMQRALPSQNCGTQLIEFLNSNQKSSNKAQALAILGAMLAAGFLQPIVPDSEQTEFDENLHYKFVEMSKMYVDALSGRAELLQTTQDTLSPQFEVSGEPQPPKSIDTSLSFHSAHDIEVESSVRSTSTTSKLLESYCDHEEQLLAQMLRSYNLDLNWAKVLTPLCCRAANHFKPEYCTNELMDIRSYVNFKKVPGGKRQECTIVGGVVFSKNVAHKEMATRVKQPRILLLQCPVVYERIEGKFVSIETVLLQEKEYLRNVCARIMSFKPNVVLVHKNVAGVAQDILRSQGITLVLDVKLSVMERLARTLQCDILSSIESNITKPRLGMCDAFYIRSYSDGGGLSKTLMFFEKLTNPRGFTCLLRGGNDKELAKVKKVAAFLVYARYNWLLEMSFLLDEFAEPLTPKPPIFDSKEPSPDETPKTAAVTEDEPQLRSPAILANKRFSERKSEDKILAVTSENVADFTDPLRSKDLPTNNNYTPPELAVELRYDNRFRNALSSTLLSVSPFVTFPLPYLETEQGRKCALRSLFPPELYFSKLWSNASMNQQNNNAERQDSHNELIISNEDNETQLNPPHQFLKLKITTPIDNRDIQTLLSEFRAFGARFPKKKKMFKLLKRRQSHQQPQKICDELVFKDALDIQNHQRLAVLFCSFYFDPKSASSASFCAPPTLLDMTFYGHQDIMLGQFLQRYCCRHSSICTVCNLPMLGHIRRYVHSMGCVQVFLSEDHTKTDPNRLFFSAWCSICKAVIPSVPLSETSKCLSFAKYLELRFHGHAYKRRAIESLNQTTPNDAEATKCQHSLHRDYVHYFSFRGVGAKFQYTPIDAWEIGMPTLVVQLKPPKPIDSFQILEEIKIFSMKGHEVYTHIHERIADLASEVEDSPLVANLKTILSKDQFHFKQQIEIVQTLLIDNKANGFDIFDAVLMAKRVLAESIEVWSPRLHEIALAQKIAIKQQQQHQQQQQQQQQLQTSDAAINLQVDAGLICTEDLRSDQSECSPTVIEAATQAATDFAFDKNVETPATTAATTSNTTATATAAETTHAAIEKKSSADQLITSSNNSKSIKKMLIHLLPSTGPINLLQSPFAVHEYLTLPLGAFPVLVCDQDLSSVIAYSLTSNDYQRSMAALNATSVQIAGSDSIGASSSANPSPNLKRKSQESILEEEMNTKNTATSNATSANNNNSTTTAAAAANNNNEEERTKSKNSSSHIELSFQDHSTTFSCKIYFAKEFDLMRARTLKPPKLDKSLYKELEQKKRREELKVSQSRTGAEMELVRKPSDASTHFKAHEAAAGSNSHKDDILDEIEESRNALARSLCSSVHWEARGGKSGSRFCKTSDERFVLKEMSKIDVSIFENFAPNYFEYLAKCQQLNQPTLLVKIFGVFKVTIKKKENTQEKTLLVMENLFYDCDIQNKFDLKGSERNRLVNPKNEKESEIVLLDENLVQMSWSKPLYILSHSKAVLKDAINRDASFLEKNQVMDYSLLVGLDNKSNTLVLGIIDYIRTFTLDKRFESFVKQTGILGGMGKLPTVISPERYKQRFIDAMDRYFYTVPDRWEGLSKI